MEAIDAFTDFSRCALPDRETDLSRRYLRILLRWIPVGMATFESWPGRPECGHFFGGVLWYCQETVMPMVAIAAACSSSAFDEKLAGADRDSLRTAALRALRYACFTHDTGPADCVRPNKSWGRTEPAGKKWGERGRGFFPESQCGRQLADLALTAFLIRDLLGDEERRMLAAIAADYLARFGALSPSSGVYYDTQTEEDAWTSLGLTAATLLLEKHPMAEQWREHALLWLFRAVSVPGDMHDLSVFADGKTVRDLAGKTCTTLPDFTAENHGFVHPSYMASSINLSGSASVLWRLWGAPIPPHALWHRRDIYEVLKRWSDDLGSPHAVQGMDWPYFALQSHALLHAMANLNLGDPDASLLEHRALEAMERSSEAHGGRLVPEETARYCHCQQDPAVMRERSVGWVAHAYLAHRIAGDGEPPSELEAFRRGIQGVHLYPHGGALVHVHPVGRTSFAWRNRSMVLPSPREGLALVGHAAESWLARIEVEGRSRTSRQVALKIREAEDRVCALFEEDIAQGTVRRMVFFASLPDGRCFTYERLLSLADVRASRIEQGYLSIVNDGILGEHPDRRGRRTIFWQGGTKEVVGYPAGSAAEDLTIELGETRWVNIDDRCGVVFQGSGRAVYVNRHHFRVWHAVEDDLVLGLHEGPLGYRRGKRIAELSALWCPQLNHDATAGEKLKVQAHDDELVLASVDGYLLAANFGRSSRPLPPELPAPKKQPLRACGSLSLNGDGASTGTLRIEPGEPLILG